MIMVHIMHNVERILLLVMLTRIFTQKSNAPLDKFPNFHCKEKNSSQMPGNAWGWGGGVGGGDGQFWN